MKIYSIPFAAGRLGISPIPGGSGAYDADFQAVCQWGAAVVLTMTTLLEMQGAGCENLGSDLRKSGIDWHHLPVADFGAPGRETSEKWQLASAAARDALNAGANVLVHCRGGCGRSGMAALRIMVEMGAAPEQALSNLRSARPCAIETDQQYAWAIQTHP